MWKSSRLGWVVATGIAGLMLAGGFQPASEKTGVVNQDQVARESEFGKKAIATVQNMQAARKGVLEFVLANRLLTLEQASKFRDLSLLPSPTAAQKAELEKIKADAKASAAKSQELAQKQNPTDDDKALMAEYANRANQMERTIQEWDRQFSDELRTMADKQQAETVERVQATIKELAKAQGFTMVFDASVVPYGANDLTADAVKAMNAKK